MPDFHCTLYEAEPSSIDQLTCTSPLPANADTPPTFHSCGTVSDTPAVSFSPPLVHTAPVAAQSDVAGSKTLASAEDAGSTLILQAALLGGAVRFALLTLPPVTVNTSSRIAASVTVTSWLNETRNVNPSEACHAGAFENVAVSVPCSSPGRTVTRSPPMSSKPPPDGWCTSVTAASETVSSSAATPTVTVRAVLQSSTVNARLAGLTETSVPSWPVMLTVTVSSGLLLSATS